MTTLTFAHDEEVVDPEAAFVTSQWIAEYRHMDSIAEKPKIIGPDKLAKYFTSPKGKALAEGFAEATERPLKEFADQIIDRTVFYDQQVMEAHEKGCRQFVILAAGMDAR